MILYWIYMLIFKWIILNILYITYVKSEIKNIKEKQNYLLL